MTRFFPPTIFRNVIIAYRERFARSRGDIGDAVDNVEKRPHGELGRRQPRRALDIQRQPGANINRPPTA